MPQVHTTITEFTAEIEVDDYCATIEAEECPNDPDSCRFYLHYVGNDHGRDDRRAKLPPIIQTHDHLTMQTAVAAALAALKWAIRYDIDNLQDHLDALPETIEAPDTPPVMEASA